MGSVTKIIAIIAFRGIGFSESQELQEPALIRAGHVGLQFEGDSRIFGFHPTDEATRQIGGEEAALEWLKAHKPLEGTLQDDTAIFVRASRLAEQGARTIVWQMDIQLSDERFEAVRALAFEWYNTGKLFPYGFPGAPASDNCATFPRHLGLPLPEPTGQLRLYIPVIESQQKPWLPEED